MLLMLKDFRCQRNNFHVNRTKLTRNRTEDTTTAKLSCIIQQDTGVVVETDI